MVKLLLPLLLLAACGKESSSSSPQTLASKPTPVSKPVEERPTPEVPPPQVEVEEEDAYLKLVNDHRERLGLRPLRIAPFIIEVARSHSEAMGSGRKFFGHGGWRGRCALLREKLGGNLCGENVARGQKTPEDVFEAWLNSPPHREVIEGETYTHTGLGTFVGRDGRIYWTQMFLEIL